MKYTAAFLMFVFASCCGTTYGTTYDNSSVSNVDIQQCIAVCQARYEECKERNKHATNCASLYEWCVNGCN
jgi:hypothetical protein